MTSANSSRTVDTWAQPSCHYRTPTLRRRLSRRKVPPAHYQRATRRCIIRYGDSSRSESTWIPSTTSLRGAKYLWLPSPVSKADQIWRMLPSLQSSCYGWALSTQTSLCSPPTMALQCVAAVCISLSSVVSETDYSLAKDQQFNMLVSRVAGLGELRHKPIGFTGPLSQHLLGYNSIINVVRQTLRDLIEVTSTHMFLTGSCNRSSVDLSQIATK